MTTNNNSPRLTKGAGRLGAILCSAITMMTVSDPSIAAENAENKYDVVVYGGTPGGVAAAVSASRQGQKVILIEPQYFVGGMLAGGLTKTDLGNRDTIGGLSREFFGRVKAYYDKTFGPDSIQAKQTNDGAFFEPKTAALIFREMLDEAKVEVLLKHRLVSADVSRDRIESIKIESTESGDSRSIQGRVFIDATYEGDLLAAANVPYRVGREAREEYGESLAGMNEGPEIYRGKGDHRVQAYNMRSTITNRADILVPFPKPDTYTPEPHKSFVEYVKKHNLKTFEELFHDAPLWGEVNGKLDPNKADAVGLNLNYAEADPEGRAKIVKAIQDYWLSLWYMLQTDPELPEEFRKSVEKWGLPKDEFVESNHVSPQVYVRVARRMLGRYMLTQVDVMDDRFKEDSICLGSYNIDSHDIQKIRTPKGLINEGYLIQSTDPYEIPYRAITPFAPSNLLVVCAVSATHIAYGTLRMEPVFMMLGDAAGMAASMAIKNSCPVQDISVPDLQAYLKKAGIAIEAPFRPKVEIAVNEEGPFQVGQVLHFDAEVVRSKSDVTDYQWSFDGSGEVQATEKSAKFKFDTPGVYEVQLSAKDADGKEALLATMPVQIGDSSEGPEEVVFSEIKPTGRWDRAGSGLLSYRFRTPYHDMNSDKGSKSVVFETTLPESGKYKVSFAYAEDGNRSANTPVTVEHAGGSDEIIIDQRKKPSRFAFTPLGVYSFEKGKPARVIVGNKDTEGYVVVDAVRWIRVE